MNNRFVIGVAAVVLGVIVWVSFPKGDKEIKEVVKSIEQKMPQKISAQALYERAERLRNDNKLAEAKSVYQEILSESADFEKIEEIQANLELTNMSLIFSNSPSENSVTHKVVVGDTLGKLAKKYGTTISLIKQNNHLKNDIIRVGQRLRIWTGQFSLFVDKSQNTLLLKMGTEVLKVYEVSTGKDNSTPVGEFKVTSKLVDPVWFHRGVVVPPESPDNVLGSRWLGFDIPGYGIHGTVYPDKIGQQVTAGCVRMRNPEIEELYMMIPLKTPIVVVD